MPTAKSSGLCSKCGSCAVHQSMIGLDDICWKNLPSSTYACLESDTREGFRCTRSLGDGRISTANGDRFAREHPIHSIFLRYDNGSPKDSADVYFGWRKEARERWETSSIRRFLHWLLSVLLFVVLPGFRSSRGTTTPSWIDHPTRSLAR